MNTSPLIDRKSKARKGKKVTISTTFDCTIDQVWQRIQNVSTLVEICRPLARFTPRKAEMPTNWAVGKTYDFNLYLHCVVPVGKHTIVIEKMDATTHQIQSREHNALVPVWNHLITIRPTRDGKVEYTDQIEIYAGILTSVVAWWSGRFYQHRQRKWKAILRK